MTRSGGQVTGGDPGVPGKGQASDKPKAGVRAVAAGNQRTERHQGWEMKPEGTASPRAPWAG